MVGGILKEYRCRVIAECICIVPNDSLINSVRKRNQKDHKVAQYFPNVTKRKTYLENKMAQG